MEPAVAQARERASGGPRPKPIGGTPSSGRTPTVCTNAAHGSLSASAATNTPGNMKSPTATSTGARSTEATTSAACIAAVLHMPS
jgi:hypothetical protein